MTMLAYDLDPEQTWPKAHRLLKMFRLDNKLNWFPAEFSKGMKQKVMICCAFLPDVKLLIVDEPFYGLDPLAVHDLLQLIEEVKKKGTAVLMSTHVLDTAERYCDRFVLLASGQVRAHGTLDELRQVAGQPSASLDQLYLQMTGDGGHE